MKQLRGFFLVLSLLCSLSMLYAQPLETAQNPQVLLLGYRAARLDALRQMAETIKGIRIDASTTVENFVTTSDHINSALTAFITGARDAAAPEFKPDGTCEVTLVLDGNLLMAELRNLSQQFNAGFNMGQMPPQGEIRVTGTGAIPSSEFPMFIGWDRVQPQGKLMARRGAQIDAQRNLAEAVLGVQIASTTTVENFITQRDEIRTNFSHIIQGVQYAEAEYLPNGLVKIRGWLDYPAVVANQQRLHNMQPQYPPVPFPMGPVEMYGYGVCDPNFYRWEPIVPPQPPQNPEFPGVPGVPDWAGQTHKVTGTGAIAENAANPAQARLMARRAAFLDGYRQMLEYVQGLRIDGETNVENFVTKYDVVKTQINGWIKGVKPLETRYNQDGTVEVDFVLDLSRAWEIVQPFKK